jgi:hypothetical protein
VVRLSLQRQRALSTPYPYGKDRHDERKITIDLLKYLTPKLDLTGHRCGTEWMMSSAQFTLEDI